MIWLSREISLADGYQILDSDSGTVPVHVDTFMMIGGPLVTKIQQKIVFCFPTGSFCVAELMTKHIYPSHIYLSRIYPAPCIYYISCIYSAHIYVSTTLLSDTHIIYVSHIYPSHIYLSRIYPAHTHLSLAHLSRTYLYLTHLSHTRLPQQKPFRRAPTPYR